MELFTKLKSIPKPPEGYYSSGPNPNLRSFVEEHAKRIDPNYERTPFTLQEPVSKADPIYNMHTYWSKKHYKAIMEYINHYTDPGDLVLDPFCGSGMTGVAALALGRIPILVDLSPAATFITKHYCTPVDVDELESAFKKLMEKVKPEMDWLYETRCDRCGGKATTGYVVWSERFRCERCLNIVSLYDCPEQEITTYSPRPSRERTGEGERKTKKVPVCPKCLANGYREPIDTGSQKFGAVPVEVSYLCEMGCKPQRANRTHNDENERKREYFEKYDLGKLEEIERLEIPYDYPKNRMMNTPEREKRWGLLWRRGIHEGIERVDHFFTKRNLWALALLRNHINEIPNMLADMGW